MAHWAEEQVCQPAAALAVAGLIWACAHPASFHIVKCLAAAIPVQAGYASTTRKTARGQLKEGAFFKLASCCRVTLYIKQHLSCGFA